MLLQQFSLAILEMLCYNKKVLIGIGVVSGVEHDDAKAGVLELVDEVDSKSCSSIHRCFCRTLGITAYFQLNNSIWF